MDYGATDHGGDVHLTLESDDGAPANANAPPRAGGSRRVGRTMGVTGRGARRRLALDTGSAPRELEWGGRYRGWTVACAVGCAFLAGVALALALVASTGAGGDLRRLLAAPRDGVGSFRSSSSSSSSSSVASAAVRTPLPGLALAGPTHEPARTVTEDDGRPSVTVGFESSGDFYWLPMVRLLEAALPGVKITLADPTYDWSAVNLADLTSSSRRNGRRQGVTDDDDDDDDDDDGSHPARDVRVVATSDPSVEPDIVVEGPDIFRAGRDEGSRCAWGDKPWVQTTAEPSMFFNAWEWCRHETDPVMRLETGLAHFNQDLVYDAKKTTYVWSPYAMTHAWLMRDHLADRLRAFRDNPPDLRRHMVGWASGNCQEHRAQIFRALQRASNRGWREGRVDELGRDGAVHALGACEHNVRWSSSDEYPPRGTKPWELYKDYRWVLALENSAEPGYVTEKLVNAMASGAVPVYYGDSRAARKVFKRGTFVDVLEIWRLKGHVPGDPEVPGSPPTEADWDVIADYVVAIDRDPDLYAKFFAHSNALNEEPESEVYDDAVKFEIGVDYPNEPFPQIDRPVGEQIGPDSGATREAVWRLRDLFRKKLEERDAWELRRANGAAQKAPARGGGLAAKH